LKFPYPFCDSHSAMPELGRFRPADADKIY